MLAPISNKLCNKTTGCRLTQGLLSCWGLQKVAGRPSVADLQLDPFGIVPNRRHKVRKCGMAFLANAAPRIPNSKTGIQVCSLLKSTLVCNHRVLLETRINTKLVKWSTIKHEMSQDPTHLANPCPKAPSNRHEQLDQHQRK